MNIPDYVDILVRQVSADYTFLNQGWPWFFVFPAVLYLLLALGRIALLTAPVWLPISLIISSIRFGKRRK
jgi:hypothetical protein